MLLEGQGFVRAASDTLLATLRQHGVAAIAEARDRRHRHQEQRGAQTDADQGRRRYCNENNLSLLSKVRRASCTMSQNLFIDIFTLDIIITAQKLRYFTDREVCRHLVWEITLLVL